MKELKDMSDKKLRQKAMEEHSKQEIIRMWRSCGNVIYSQDKWTDINDRMPSDSLDGHDMLVYHPDWGIDLLEYRKSGHFKHATSEPTHWMELPAKPRVTIN